jgi:hypothetical protein
MNYTVLLLVHFVICSKNINMNLEMHKYVTINRDETCTQCQEGIKFETITTRRFGEIVDTMV